MLINYKEAFAVIWQSLKESFLLSWKWLLGSIGALAAILKAGKDFFGLEIKNSVIVGISCLLLIYFIRFLIFFIKNSLKHFHEKYQNSRYGEALIILKDSFAQAHAYRKTPGYKDVEFMSAMLLFCNNLKIIFDSLTSGDCCISIKIPLEDNKVHEKTVLSNLTRDVEHKGRDTKEYMQTKHTLIGNTAFSYSLSRVLQGQPEKHYVNNDVNGTKNYLNTSKISRASEIHLDYNSELVHPIVPIINLNNNNFDCLGFICVDCDKKNVFTSKYHIAIIEGVADGLYDIISQVHQNK